MHTKKAILRTKNLTKRYNQNCNAPSVLSDLSLSFEQGLSYAIIGASGSGKSTLLHLLGGLDEPTSGKVLLNNTNIFSLSSNDKDSFYKNIIGFVFQFHYLIQELSVLENVMLAGIIAGMHFSEARWHALDLLHFVDLGKKSDIFPYQLSGGEQQRVAVVRAVFNRPKFLLADEPTGNLDKQNASVLVDLMILCQQKWQTGLIICSHDKAVYQRMEYILKIHDRSVIKM